LGVVVRVVVDVMLKPEILDPQGQAIARALPSLGFGAVGGVRQGKHFELDLGGDDEQALAAAERIAHTLLANPVIEDYTVRLEEPSA
jgi:phosphoribosylformylglycinamidine synthase